MIKGAELREAEQTTNDNLDLLLIMTCLDIVIIAKETTETLRAASVFIATEPQAPPAAVRG
eukprot:3725305-Pyramimonas_sp.AAC.1